MEEQLQRLGIRAERLEAVDGRDLTDQERGLVNRAKRNLHSPHPLSDNEIACYLSHVAAIQALLASGEPMAAIFEDDALLTDRLPAVQTLIEQSRFKFDLIDLYRSDRHSFFPCLKLSDDLQIGRLTGGGFSNVGYVISRAGAQRFLARPIEITNAMDKELRRWWANGMDVYGVRTGLVREIDGPSFNDETRHVPRTGPSTTASLTRKPSEKYNISRWLFRQQESFRKRALFPAFYVKGLLNARGTSRS